MKRLQTLTTALLFISLGTALGQTRMIGHVSKEAGGFRPEIIMANRSDLAVNFKLIPYLSNGTELSSVNGTLAANATEYRTVQQLFGASDVSHFAIEGPDEILVSITYEATKGQASPVHVHESATQAELWRVYPGDWSVIWDGLAVVNTGASAATITVEQQDRQGRILASYRGLSGLGSMAKALLVLGSDFQQRDDAHFVIVSDRPLSLTSLRGSLNGSGASFLWENRAEPEMVNKSSSGTPTVGFSRIDATQVDLRSNGAVDLAQVTIHADGPGRIVVRFDGWAVSDLGDRMILAASDRSRSWDANDGNVGVLLEDSFSHTRVYEVSQAGDYTFYAVGENFVDTNGSGIGSVYGSLTAEFYP